jgi:tetratricopeptide (TPR) repeat protein
VQSTFFPRKLNRRVILDSTYMSTSDLPTTDLPTTDLPTTDLPTTDLPTTDLPTTDLPTTEADQLADDISPDDDMGEGELLEDSNDDLSVVSLDGRRVAFVGKLGGMTKREAQQVVRQHGGVPFERIEEAVDIIVMGADHLPLSDPESLLDDDLESRAAAGELEIVSEADFWQRLGIDDGDQSERNLYTPAMLADLIGVSVATIRRWHRLNLIVPTREVHRLPYFDFQEVATARRIAELLSAGATVAAIEKKLAELSQFYPNAERPLAQLSVIVEGKQILLRQGEGLIEPGGQLRINFDLTETDGGECDATIMFPSGAPPSESEPVDSGLSADATPANMLSWAHQLEDDGDLISAAEMYRAVLAGGGPSAEVCFQLADVLYRLGDLAAARERYYMAIELDENYVEARANLGCVLTELGQLDLAVAAFQGALAFHDDYPDVHFHLARTFDDLDEPEQARGHWEDFLRLAPDSPWAGEAMHRLDLSNDEELSELELNGELELLGKLELRDEIELRELETRSELDPGNECAAAD